MEFRRCKWFSRKTIKGGNCNLEFWERCLEIWKFNFLKSNFHNLKSELIQTLKDYPEVVKQAGMDYDPAVIANYVYELAKEFNQFYHDHSILKEEDKLKRYLRLVITDQTALVIRKGMQLLGIGVPERM